MAVNRGITRKLVSLQIELDQEIAAYRWSKKIKFESAAIRELIRLGLDAAYKADPSIVPKELPKPKPKPRGR